MYSNVVESFNTWIKEMRHLLVTNMVDSIRLAQMRTYIFVKCIIVCYYVLLSVCVYSHAFVRNIVYYRVLY